MSPSELARKLEAIDRRLQHWAYANEPHWMRELLDDNRRLFSDAASLLRDSIITMERDDVSTHYCIKCEAPITLASIGGRCLSCWADEDSERARAAECIEHVAKIVQKDLMPSGASVEAHESLAKVAGRDVADACERGMVKAKRDLGLLP